MAADTTIGHGVRSNARVTALAVPSCRSWGWSHGGALLGGLLLLALSRLERPRSPVFAVCSSWSAAWSPSVS
jgi:hypothetical protein